MKRITVNRKLFMAWTEGILLSRDRNGVCLVTDDKTLQEKFEAAEKAMGDGKTIYLTNDEGQVVTKMSLEDEGYVESEIATKGAK